MLKRLFGRGGGDEPTPARQEGDVHALERAGDPRGGVQSEDYRHARPEDVVEEGDVTMAGPGGAPADDGSVEDRRQRDRSDESAA
jgi:hypothetical protein